MQRAKAAKQRLMRLARTAAQTATDWTQRSALKLVETAHERGEALRNGERGHKVADAVLKAGERLIESSPVPVPLLVRDALGRMQDALGQLGNAIDVEGATAAPEKAAEVVRGAAALAAKQHYAGQVAGLSPADIAKLDARNKGAQQGKGKHA